MHLAHPCLASSHRIRGREMRPFSGRPVWLNALSSQALAAGQLGLHAPPPPGTPGTPLAAGGHPSPPSPKALPLRNSCVHRGGEEGRPLLPGWEVGRPVASPTFGGDYQGLCDKRDPAFQAWERRHIQAPIAREGAEEIGM